MKIQYFILGISLGLLCACTGGGGYQRHYIISDTSEQSSYESSP
ncbi:hypothetical protein [Candidatus Rhabdochlamydia sp. T3358]|jgi:hypothetical protein|nr:hypothetical protein [Candidatus Rhabdochlamydia sp. T3358]VHO04719.1 hypothetical protein RHT_01479 [Candidatus Rhabdochlamydia sp. T3358]